MISTLSSNISTANVENFATKDIILLSFQRITENKATTPTKPSILDGIDSENRKKLKQGVTQRRTQEKDNQGIKE